MQKITYAITIFIVFSCHLQAQILKNKKTLEDFGLKGKVMKITYDESDSYSTERYSYFFARDGKITLQENMISSHEYVYNEDRKIQKIYFKIGEKLKDSTVFQYNAKGWLISRHKDDLFVTNTYDANGRKASMQIIYNKKDTIVKKFEYDKSDRIIKEIDLSKRKGGSNFYFTVTYDDRNNITSASEYGEINPNAYNERIDRFFTYNAKNDEISFKEMTKIFQGKKLLNTSVYSYTVTYQYDAKGNWIKKKYKKNNGKVDTVLRIIEYY